jgi:hypothetical protein
MSGHRETKEATKNDEAQPDGESGLRQLALEGFGGGETGNRPQGAGSSDAIEQRSRMFVPTNRELIIEQLAGMVLETSLAQYGASGVPFVVMDGVSRAEIEQLAHGRPQRFPVLVEVRSDAARLAAGAFGVSDIVGLRFRNQAEADAFRHRPFDELDTDYFPCKAEPGLFDIDPPVRPDAVRESGLSEADRPVDVADRVAGAICCLLALGAAEPSCWMAISDLLCGHAARTQQSGFGLRTALSLRQGPAAAVGEFVVGAFMEHERGSSGMLIERLGQRLMQSPSDPAMWSTVSRWLETARAVLGNRTVMNGDILSDSGSIPLRAAILAAMVDDVDNLASFLHAERPAGRMVASAAALLLGLRSGVRSLSWRRKQPHLRMLSSLLVALHDARADEQAGALEAFELEPEERPSGVEFVLRWRGLTLARWTEHENESVPPVASSDLPSIVATVCGKQIEVIGATGEGRTTALRVSLAEGDRLRKPRDILEAACSPGIFWHVGMSADGTNILCADVPGPPDQAVLNVAASALPEALAKYLVPAKRSKKNASTTRRRTKRNVESP